MKTIKECDLLTAMLELDNANAAQKDKMICRFVDEQPGISRYLDLNQEKNSFIKSYKDSLFFGGFILWYTLIHTGNTPCIPDEANLIITEELNTKAYDKLFKNATGRNIVLKVCSHYPQPKLLKFTLNSVSDPAAMIDDKGARLALIILKTVLDCLCGTKPQTGRPDLEPCLMNSVLN